MLSDFFTVDLKFDCQLHCNGFHGVHVAYFKWRHFRLANNTSVKRPRLSLSLSLCYYLSLPFPSPPLSPLLSPPLFLHSPSPSLSIHLWITERSSLIMSHLMLRDPDSLLSGDLLSWALYRLIKLGLAFPTRMTPIRGEMSTKTGSRVIGWQTPN